MKLYDLSHLLTPNTPAYPGDDALSAAKARCLSTHGFNAYKFSTGMHIGTHVEVPMHLTADTRSICEFPVESFCGPGVLLDVRNERTITMKPEYESKVAEGCVVILYTGFSDYFYNPEKYFREHPEIDAELTDFFINKKIRMLGMDMPSPDRPPFKAHLKLLENNIIMLENLTSLHQLKGLNNFQIFAAPLKIEAEASLVRAYARELYSK